jgi:acyl-coenzyme A synthetase/AMP-(fatty) acid ligase
MPGLRVDLVDQDGNTGDVGQSIVSGTQISRGYWDNKFLTQQKFKPHPHHAHCRAYHTGDILRKDKNGFYYFQGRQDDQTKIRGHRVELGEVEAAFLSFAEVHSAAVVAFSDTDSSYDQKLFAFVEGDENLDVQSLKKKIADILPAYMMPSGVTRLDELPRNQNGKIDRQTLKLYISKKDVV